MKFIEKLQVIERVDGLIRRKATGSPSNLSRKLMVSERCVYDIISLMKSMEAPIYFCSSRNSYCYEYEVDLILGFISQRKITGGRSCDLYLQYQNLNN